MSLASLPPPCIVLALASLSLVAQVGAQEGDAQPTEELRIHYDALRIPHVFAASDEGVFYGLGYTQARDFPVATLANLWSATGRFAEVAGKLVVKKDERVRQAGLDELARAQLAGRLEPGIRRLLEAYVAGVEAGRHWWLADPVRLDRLAGEDGREMGFDPVPGWLSPLLTREDLRARLQRLFEAQIELFHVLAFGNAVNAGVDFPGHGYGLATNLWFARDDEHGKRAVSYVDTHQPLKRGGLRSYFVQLSGPTYDVAGFSMPGHPCVLVGFNRELSWGLSSLPKVPIEPLRAGLSFRPVAATPVVKNTWQAVLEPDLPLRFTMEDGTVVQLEERAVTLRHWDVGSRSLVADPRGELRFSFVPESAGPLADEGLFHPVTDPRPGTRIAPGSRIRFEGRNYLGGASLWEAWIALGRARHVGPGAGGLDEVLERGILTIGRGENLLAVDVHGGLEYVWTGRYPVQGEHAQSGEAVLDGRDPLARWQGFHALEELPRFLDRSGFGERAEAWLNCNVTPHYVRARSEEFAFEGPPSVYGGLPWKTLRQDRARELFDRALEDGTLALDEVTEIGLDLQDPWARSRWPLISALRGAEEPLGDAARRFLDWVEAFRFERADGTPGGEEFIAHPLSQVTPFLVLVRDGLEEQLLALREPTLLEAGFAFDPVQGLPAPEEFLAEVRWRRCRETLRSSVEWTAELFLATLEERSGGLSNRRLFPGLVARMKACGGPFTEAWNDPLYAKQGQGWGPDAPEAPLVRWGQVNVYSLTPHQPANLPARESDFERWSSAIFEPCALELPFFRSQTPVVFPFGGTRDSMYQSHREGVFSYRRALFPASGGKLLVAPINFGIQVPFCVELREGEAPRARVLPAMAATEILCAIPEGPDALAFERLEQFRPTRRFAAGLWSELVLDEDALADQAGVRTLRLERPLAR